MPKTRFVNCPGILHKLCLFPCHVSVTGMGKQPQTWLDNQHMECNTGTKLSTQLTSISAGATGTVPRFSPNPPIPFRRNPKSYCWTPRREKVCPSEPKISSGIPHLRNSWGSWCWGAKLPQVQPLRVQTKKWNWSRDSEASTQKNMAPKRAVVNRNPGEGSTFREWCWLLWWEGDCP